MIRRVALPRQRGSILARVDTVAFEHHLTSPQGHGRLPDDGFAATAGG